MYLVESLKANILIENDILYTKGFIINLTSASAYILSYGVTIIISIKSYSLFLKRNILANATTFISLKSETLVNFQQITLPDSCDFLFQPFCQQYLILYSYLLNYTSLKILIRNNTKHLIQIPMYHRLGWVTKVSFENCSAALADHDAVSTPPMSFFLFYERNDITIPPAGAGLEIELSNGIKIYDDGQAIEKIIRLVKKYSSI